MSSKCSLLLLTVGRIPELTIIELDSWLGRASCSGVERWERAESSKNESLHPVLLSVYLTGETEVDILRRCISNCSLIRHAYHAEDALHEQKPGSGELEQLAESWTARFGGEDRVGAVAQVIEVGRRTRPRSRGGAEAGPSSFSHSEQLHIVADLRSLDASAARDAQYHVMRVFCSGGDKAANLAAEKFNCKKARDALSATTTFATTRMDFIRCFLTCVAAQISPGDWVLDPFAGSGGILEVASLFQTPVCVGVEIDGDCCRAASRIVHERILADSINLHFNSTTKFDVIVTDPPYGIRTSKCGNQNALETLLKLAARCLDVKTGRLVCWWWHSRNSHLNAAKLATQRLLDELNSPLQLRQCVVDDHGLGQRSTGGEGEESSWVRLFMVFTMASNTLPVPRACCSSPLPLVLNVASPEIPAMDAVKRACWRGDLQTLVQLASEGIKIEQSCLLTAAGFGKLGIVTWLVETQRLAISDSSCVGGETALIRASRHGHAAVVTYLLNQGASAGYRDTVQASSAISYAVAHDHLKVLASFSAIDVDEAVRSEFLLHVACQWGSSNCLEFLLLANNAATYPHTMPDGTTTLHLCARYNHITSAELLMANGLDWQLDAKTPGGDTALDVALKWNRKKAAAWLQNILISKNIWKTKISS